RLRDDAVARRPGNRPGPTERHRQRTRRPCRRHSGHYNRHRPRLTLPSSNPRGRVARTPHGRVARSDLTCGAFGPARQSSSILTEVPTQSRCSRSVTPPHSVAPPHSVTLRARSSHYRLAAPWSGPVTSAHSGECGKPVVDEHQHHDCRPHGPCHCRAAKLQHLTQGDAPKPAPRCERGTASKPYPTTAEPSTKPDLTPEPLERPNGIGRRPTIGPIRPISTRGIPRRRGGAPTGRYQARHVKTSHRMGSRR